MPTTAPKARILLKQRRARVFRLYPFTIQLKYETRHKKQPVEIRIDYGAKTHGIALVQQCRTHDSAIFLGEAKQRQDVKKKMDIRRELRRARRYRNTRYRKRRFYRRLPKGWVPPTIAQRIGSITRILKTTRKMTPITSAIAEIGMFDTQKFINSEIDGIEYQRGPSYGFENKKQATLAYFAYTCQYCGTSKGVMTVDHVTPRGKGGTDIWSNLTCACLSCNTKKGDRTPEEAGMQSPNTVNPRNQNFIKFCAYMQRGKTALVEELQKLVPTRTAFGWQTKRNREEANLRKTHYLDALCTESIVQRPVRLTTDIHEIRLRRRNIRQTHMANPKKSGKRQRYNANKTVKGYKKGDLILTQHGLGYIDALTTSGRLMYCTAKGRMQVIPRKAERVESSRGTQFLRKTSPKEISLSS